MDAPPVQYVKTSDGYNIAYCEAGTGQPLVFLPQAFNHVGYSWRFYASWYQGLAARFRLVWYDARGCGLSDRGLRPDYSFTDNERDLEAVLDALSLGTAVLFGPPSSTHMAIRWAIEHPQRVEALALITPTLDYRAWPQAVLNDLSRERWELFLYGLVPHDLSSEASEARLNELKESCTPEDWQITWRALQNRPSIEAEISALKTPTLVIHPRHYRLLPAEEGRKLAAAIPHARFTLISGDTLYGDSTEGIAAIENFLSNLPKGTQPGSVTADTSNLLSARETEVLRLLAAGKSNQQIAEELVISLNTVNRHVSNIYSKTGAANRAEATGYAHRHGLAD